MRPPRPEPVRRATRHLLCGAVLLVLSCAPVSARAPEVGEPPAKVEAGRITLSAKAAERLGIQTVALREEPLVRMRKLWAEVLVGSTPSGAPGSDPVLVRVALLPSELLQIDRTKPAAVRPLAAATPAQPPAGPAPQAIPQRARLVDPPKGTKPSDAATSLYYALEGAPPGFAVGQRVPIELVLLGSGTPRKVIPYGAVFYGLRGETWTYLRLAPLVFARAPISVDFIEADLAVLHSGPDVGSAVVSVGGAELFGIETGVGK